MTDAPDQDAGLETEDYFPRLGINLPNHGDHFPNNPIYFFYLLNASISLVKITQGIIKIFLLF
jgi:hypothetical protein